MDQDSSCSVSSSCSPLYGVFDLLLKPFQIGLDKGHIGKANIAIWTENWLADRIP